MIIDPETGTIIAKGDKTNKRHLWSRIDLIHWECQKCECHKEQFGDKQFQYWKNGEKFNHAPECDNSKIEIITNTKKNVKQEDKQLSLW